MKPKKALLIFSAQELLAVTVSSTSFCTRKNKSAELAANDRLLGIPEFILLTKASLSLVDRLIFSFAVMLVDFGFSNLLLFIASLEVAKCYFSNKVSCHQEIPSDALCPLCVYELIW